MSLNDCGVQAYRARHKQWADTGNLTTKMIASTRKQIETLQANLNKAGHPNPQQMAVYTKELQACEDRFKQLVDQKTLLEVIVWGTIEW